MSISKKLFAATNFVFVAYLLMWLVPALRPVTRYDRGMAIFFTIVVIANAALSWIRLRVFGWA